MLTTVGPSMGVCKCKKGFSDGPAVFDLCAEWACGFLFMIFFFFRVELLLAGPEEILSVDKFCLSTGSTVGRVVVTVMGGVGPAAAIELMGDWGLDETTELLISILGVALVDQKQHS